jgi:tetratricopeptide (TPR) repeat protein
MRLLPLFLALAACAAAPARADKRLDEALAKAEAQLARGREDEAIRILQKAAAQAARDPEAPLALAAVLTRLGRLDEAGAALGKAGDLARSAPAAVRAKVLVRRSAFALRAGTAGDAQALAREAVEASAGAETLAALARAEALLGLATARETAERAAQAGPDSAAALVARGDALFASRLDEEAEAAYRRAAQREPGSVAASVGLARVLAARGRAAPAAEAARAAAAADPHAAEAQSVLGLALLARDPADGKSEAVAAVQQAAFLEPQNPRVKRDLGRVFESRGQLDRAAAAYGEAAGLDPSWPAPRVAALGVKLRGGDAAGALSGLRALPGDFPSTGEAELLLGRILAQQEEWAGALLALDAAAARLPGLAEVHALRGAAAYEAGDLKAAAEAWGRAAELDPANLDFRTSHALHLGYDGRREEALAVLLDVAARPEGQTPSTFLRLGGLYRGFRPPRVAEAVAAYEKAQKLDPKSGEAALGVARSYRAGRQWARAITAYERVSQSFRRLDGEALVGTAWCYLRSGDDVRARFYTGLAARAGADVADLRQALSGGGGTAGGEEVADLADALRSKSAGAQARAVKGLLEIGRPAVPVLAAALARKGTSLAARELIVDGLGGLGPAAREALPQLNRLATSAPPASAPTGSREEKALREREARLVASAQEAAEKVRGPKP